MTKRKFLSSIFIAPIVALAGKQESVTVTVNAHSDFSQECIKALMDRIHESNSKWKYKACLYRGPWVDGAKYRPGDIVAFSGFACATVYETTEKPPHWHWRPIGYCTKISELLRSA